MPLGVIPVGTVVLVTGVAVAPAMPGSVLVPLDRMVGPDVVDEHLSFRGPTPRPAPPE